MQRANQVPRDSYTAVSTANNASAESGVLSHNTRHRIWGDVRRTLYSLEFSDDFTGTDWLGDEDQVLLK